MRACACTPLRAHLCVHTSVAPRALATLFSPAEVRSEVRSPVDARTANPHPPISGFLEAKKTMERTGKSLKGLVAGSGRWGYARGC